MNFVKQRNNMVKVVDKNDFTVSKEDIIDYLENSIYKNRYKVYDTFLGQEDTRWKRGQKYKFQQSLVASELNYFAYIKFYLDKDKKIALVAGKSGSKRVNTTSGCDLSFSTKPEHGEARKWLLKKGKCWCQTEIIIIWTKTASEKEAFDIERNLQKKFDLFGS